MTRLSKQERTQLLVVLALAVVVRIAAAFWLGDSLLFDDEADYVDAAQELIRTGGFDEGYRREPVYPVFLALLSLPSTGSVLSLRIGQAMVVGLGCLLLFVFARSMFDFRVAILATLVYALDPLLTIGGSLLYAETFAAVVLIASLVLARLACKRDSLWVSAMVGLSLGLLVQIRQISFVLVVVLATWLFKCIPASFARRVLHMGVIGLLFVASIVPWVVRNFEITGEFGPLATEGFEQTAPFEEEDEIEGGYFRSMVNWIWHHPDEFVERFGRNFLHFWEPYPTRLWVDDAEKTAELHNRDSRLPDKPKLPIGSRNIVSAISFGVEMTLAVLGVVIGWRTRRPEILFLGLVVLAYAFGYSIFEGRTRYRIPIMPEIFVLSGLGLAFVLDCCFSRSYPSSSASER